jgi:hypothetical protein
MPKQFWVIGAEYRDVSFEELIEGTSRVYGPYGDYDEARSIWRERSLESRFEAAKRYTIVSNAEQAKPRA